MFEYSAWIHDPWPIAPDRQRRRPCGINFKGPVAVEGEDSGGRNLDRIPKLQALGVSHIHSCEESGRNGHVWTEPWWHATAKFESPLVSF